MDEAMSIDAFVTLALIALPVYIFFAGSSRIRKNKILPKVQSPWGADPSGSVRYISLTTSSKIRY
ncbi:conserved hypothetical protein [Agrobacterium salinitolerans str. Hayward 0363]|nr:conserved hypothetical protein [Agrobacterium salinitolerans str. Hayward 0363]